MIQPWQIEMLDKMTKFKGRGVTQITGRNAGKTQMSSVAFQRLWDELHRRPVEDLKLTEGTVYGSRYHCVEPVGGSWTEMQEWCLNQFGDSGKHIWGSNEVPVPQERWYMNNRKFWFRDDADRLMFVMKWR